MDAAVNVALGGEVQDRVDARTDNRSDRVAVGDIALDEAITRVVRQVRQVRQVAGVAEAVEVDDSDLALRVEEVAHEVAADEAAATGHQNLFHERPFLHAAASVRVRFGVRRSSPLLAVFFVLQLSVLDGKKEKQSKAARIAALQNRPFSNNTPWPQRKSRKRGGPADEMGRKVKRGCSGMSLRIHRELEADRLRL